MTAQDWRDSCLLDVVEVTRACLPGASPAQRHAMLRALRRYGAELDRRGYKVRPEAAGAEGAPSLVTGRQAGVPTRRVGEQVSAARWM